MNTPYTRAAFVTHAQWATAAALVHDRPPQTTNDDVTFLDPARSGFGEDDRVLATWSHFRSHDGNPEGIDYSTIVAVHPDGSVTVETAGEEPKARHVSLRDVRTDTVRRWLWLGEDSAAHSLRSDLTVGVRPC